MPQFNKRRNRIRASDKSLVFRFSAGSLLLLFLAVVMLLNLKTIITTDWKVISLFQDGSVHLTVTPYRIMTIVLAALVCVLATLFYRRFQYDRVKQLFHRQKLARIDECQSLGEIPDRIRSYIDYEAYGRDLDLEGRFVVTNHGVFECPY
ncbi:hypothetical protein DXD50_03465 [Dorea formicigenerans]|nr:antirestriction protein ArdA [Dorea formicigenerans]RGJ66477.1 hypothetical protein DXD50_03465 [Dorea formicigenerans]